MRQIKFSPPIVAVAVCAFAFVIIVTQFWGISLKEALAGIVLYALCGLLIVGFFLRFALIFLGVFALYKMLRDRHQKQMALKLNCSQPLNS